MIYSHIHVNRCKCGWQFLALHKSFTKCPQCRDIKHDKKFCIACEKEFYKKDSNYCKICRPLQRCIACNEEKLTPFSKFCSGCGEVTLKIRKKIYYQNAQLKKLHRLKDIPSLSDICNYDCLNCVYSDCLQPVGKQDEIKGV